LSGQRRAAEGIAAATVAGGPLAEVTAAG